MRYTHLFWLVTLSLLTATPPIYAKMSEAEIEAWLNNDTDKLPGSRINEGKLHFLAKPPKKQVHHHHNTLIVHKKSLTNGWVKMQQCHQHLDKFPRAQIVYKKYKIKNLKLISSRNIEKTWIENHTIQLRNVKKGARICIEADTRALLKNKDGSFTLINGPFMRRYLDGFFPMRVSMDLRFPKNLKFVSILPPQQPGLRINFNATGVHFDAWFEGKLYTHIRLELKH
ncbi:hypothetical protein MNBD_GAMMA12-1879 [hydrothermal vent metagenome]|uniref:Uncharacterized protein n=1 Tax=hydrothermal vent metagenome TaxID=652676 RepID=A0A3B0YTQ1_9ZZZZ